MAAVLFSKANEAFVAEDYERALKLYSEAIGLDSSRDDFFVNRAHANVKLERFNDAELDSDEAIKLNPKNHTAYLRKGIALFYLEKYKEAKAALTAPACDETDTNLQSWIRECDTHLKTAATESSDSVHSQADAGINYNTSPTMDQSTDDKTSPAAVSQSPKEKPHTVTSPEIPKAAQTKYDWYQTHTHVIVTIMVKNVQKNSMKVDIDDQSMNITIKLPSGGEYILDLFLSHPVVPAQCQSSIFTSKVEIKLKKFEGIQWTKLETDREATATSAATITHFTASGDAADAVPNPAHAYPSSSHYTRDWDKLAQDIAKEEKDEKLEGDGALNKLFQDIYKDGSDEVRRAMVKSFYESGGTVLSTNWSEIGKEKVEVKPPDGMEYKQYEC